jgi:Domain of unknown function (DUF4936)
MPNDASAAEERWWFVYYRVRRADLALAAAAARRAQAGLCRDEPGLQAQLMHRPSSDEGEATLLETYHLVCADAARQSGLPAAIEAALAPALAVWQQGPRRLEIFTPCA